MVDVADLPDDFFARLQFLQPETGCLNRCTFCSQESGREVWAPDTQDFLRVIKEIGREANSRCIGVSRGRAHRPGVLFPYLDNDIGSSRALYSLVATVQSELQCRTRIATVGFSRHNDELNSTHRALISNYADALAGVRLSVTPYTDGWIGTRSGLTRQEFVLDWVNFLQIYRPLHESRSGLERGDRLAIELRFSPQVEVFNEPLTEFDCGNGVHGVRTGPFVVYGDFHGSPFELPIAEVLDPHARPTVFTHPQAAATLLADDHLRTMHTSDLVRQISSGVVRSARIQRAVTVLHMRNSDGDYLAISPNFDDDGEFHALQLYNQGVRRRVSGYLDSTRPLLNAILRVKRRVGLGNREGYLSAQWSDVDAVRRELVSMAQQLAGILDHRATFVRGEILPMFDAITSSLRSAGYGASSVFDRSFFVDTGGIVNQGRAKGLFRGLANTLDLPLTPRQEAGYGATSDSSARGNVWRLAPSSAAPFRADRGGKNGDPRSHAYLVQELDPSHLRPFIQQTGRPLRSFYLGGTDVLSVRYDDGRRMHLLPGSVA